MSLVSLLVIAVWTACTMSYAAIADWFSFGVSLLILAICIAGHGSFMAGISETDTEISVSISINFWYILVIIVTLAVIAYQFAVVFMLGG